MARADRWRSLVNSPLDVTTYDPNIVGEFIKLYYKDQAPLITVDQFEPETSYNGSCCASLLLDTRATNLLSLTHTQNLRTTSNRRSSSPTW